LINQINFDKLMAYFLNLEFHRMSKKTRRAVAEAPAISEAPITEEQITKAIEKLAYFKWLKAKCPPGDGVEFWLQAEREIRARFTESSLLIA
jgi:hypothetical protein